MYNMNTGDDIQYNGQALQDKFVLSLLKKKQNGYFVELGGNHPSEISNTYLLEKSYGWKGIMVEYDTSFRDMYAQIRPNSMHIFEDATTIDYVSAFKTANLPSAIDYLQIDLEPGNGSTLAALKNLDKNIFDNYTFATITFEHDIYSNNTNCKDTREISRNIFENRGYIRIFSDVNNDGHWKNNVNRDTLRNGGTPLREEYKGQYPFEDWYIHPTLVDMEYVNTILTNNRTHYISNSLTGMTINYNSIEY